MKKFSSLFWEIFSLSIFECQNFDNFRDRYACLHFLDESFSSHRSSIECCENFSSYRSSINCYESFSSYRSSTKYCEIFSINYRSRCENLSQIVNFFHNFDQLKLQYRDRYRNEKTFYNIIVCEIIVVFDLKKVHIFNNVEKQKKSSRFSLKNNKNLKKKQLWSLAQLSRWIHRDHCFN